MATFKMQVKCSVCGRPPHEEENIDNWRINKSSENIDLICTDCYTEEDMRVNESTTKYYICLTILCAANVGHQVKKEVDLTSEMGGMQFSPSFHLHGCRH